MADPFELHFLLKSLKEGNLTFEQFLKRAKEWAEELQQKPVPLINPSASPSLPADRREQDTQRS